MTRDPGAGGAPEESSGVSRLSLLLAMAMFVLVVDTSLMNVSISAVVIIAVVLAGIGRIRDVEYTGPRHIDVVGAVLSVIGMGGVVLGILTFGSASASR